MTLEYSIDKATFRTLVDEALRRIPTASRALWTLHAPVDPGMTLVELFAWLLEQRSFWADQTTEPLVRAVMALFGDTIMPARPAGVAITFAPEQVPDATRAYSPHARISNRTPMRVPETNLVFALRHGLFALAVKRYDTAPKSPMIRIAGDLDGSAQEDLRSGRPVEILSAKGGPSKVDIGLVLEQPPPSAVIAEPIAIMFELDTTVEPQWSPDTVPAPPPSVLRWEYKTGTGDWKPLPALDDGTLGLRRTGIVRFTLPADWSAHTMDSNGDFVGWLRISTASARFSSAPCVIAIHPNTAIARHARWTTHVATPQWLPLPGRTLQLPPEVALPLVDRTAVYVTEYDPDAPGSQRRSRWRVIPDFSRSGPADRVVVIDRERATITFGDGLNGRLPRLATGAVPQVSVTYAAGAGDAGNVSPCAWEPLWGPLPEALSHVPAIGGRDGESIDTARTRATSALGHPTRAVNPEDHATIARDTKGVAVARAHAEVGLELGECLVVPGVTTVFVVPGIRNRTRETVRANTAVAAPIADPGLLAQVRAQFAITRLVGEVVHVEPAQYRHVRVRVTVTGSPYDRAGVRRRISSRLREYLDPLIGGEDHEGWPFGDPIRPTALLGVAQREIGDRGEVDEIEIALDCEPFGACEDVAIRPYELLAVDTIDVVITATAAAEVGLR